MKIALLQLASPDDEAYTDRLTRVEAELDSLPTVDLALLPELWGTGYLHFDRYDAEAEPLDGPTVDMARRIATRRGFRVHVGSIVERTPDGRLRNTSVLVGPDGRIEHTFSKIHIFGYESLETRLLSPGDSLPVIDSPFGRLTGTTCYDLRFPGLWQEISDRGADIVTVPAAWPVARRMHWRLFTQARAVEHQLWIIACNAAGVQNGIELGGSSRVVAPTGEIVAEAGTGEETIVVDIDPQFVSATRAEFPVLGDRLADYATLRPDTAEEALR